MLWAGLGTQPNLQALLGAWGEALGLQPDRLAKLTSLQAQAQAVQATIGQRRMLLVIDDAWEAEAALALKVGGPRCAHLVTTRLPEVALLVAGTGATVAHVQELGEADGLALLARLAPEAIELEPEEARALVRAVDGLPLALTLMGRYLRAQSYSSQPRRLRSALDPLQQSKERLRLALAPAGEPTTSALLAGTSLSLMASIGTSYQALSKRERSLLLALSVFPAKPNSFSEEAALAVAGASTKTLDRVIDAGLLESSGPGRYALHQTVADYARLKRRTRKPDQRLAEFFAAYTEAHQADIGALDRETTNILAAFQQAFDLRLSASLVRGVNAFMPLFLTRGLYEVAELHLNRAEAAARAGADPGALVTTLLHLGQMAEKRGKYPQAEALLREGLTLARQPGQSERLSALLNTLGLVTSKRGDIEGAHALLQEGLALAHQRGDREQVCTLLTSLGSLAGRRGDQQRAEEYYQEALALARAMNDHERHCALLQGLGTVAARRGAIRQAQTSFREALALARSLGHREKICRLLLNLGLVSLDCGAPAEGERCLAEGLELARELGHQENICFFLTNLGMLANKRRAYEQAENYLTEGLALARELGHLEALGNLLVGLATAARRRSELARATAYLDEALTLAQRRDDRLLIGTIRSESGELALQQQCWHEATDAFGEALELGRALETPELTAAAFYGLARVAGAQGNQAGARQHAQESHTLYLSIDQERATEIAAWLASLRQPGDMEEPTRS